MEPAWQEKTSHLHCMWCARVFLAPFPVRHGCFQIIQHHPTWSNHYYPMSSLDGFLRQLCDPWSSSGYSLCCQATLFAPGRVSHSRWGSFHEPFPPAEMAPRGPVPLEQPPFRGFSHLLANIEPMLIDFVLLISKNIYLFHISTRIGLREHLNSKPETSKYLLLRKTMVSG